MYILPAWHHAGHVPMLQSGQCTPARCPVVRILIFYSVWLENSCFLMFPAYLLPLQIFCSSPSGTKSFLLTLRYHCPVLCNTSCLIFSPQSLLSIILQAGDLIIFLQTRKQRLWERNKLSQNHTAKNEAGIRPKLAWVQPVLLTIGQHHFLPAWRLGTGERGAVLQIVRNE